MKNLCNDLGGIKLGISGDTYGYYKNGQLVGFKSQADIDAAYQSGYSTGYTAGQAAGVTNHTGTYNITSNGTTDLGVHHSYRYINTNVNTQKSFILYAFVNGSSLAGHTYFFAYDKIVSIKYLYSMAFENYVWANRTSSVIISRQRQSDITMSQNQVYTLQPTDTMSGHELTNFNGIQVMCSPYFSSAEGTYKATTVYLEITLR